MRYSKRPNWDEYFMGWAIWASRRAACHHVRAGCVIVQDKRVVGMGYNGAPAGIPNCLEEGCHKEREGLEYHSSLGSGKCIGVHAEMNALSHITGLLARDLSLYTTVFPCFSCTKTLLGYDLRKLFYMGAYNEDEMRNAIELLNQRKVQVEKLTLTPEQTQSFLFNLPPVDFDVFPRRG
jgi:dCMP deaminase